MTDTLKPLIKWSGGKRDEIKSFEKWIPQEYKTYVEPFTGGGALFFYNNDVNKHNVINDVHTELITFYKCIKEGNGVTIYNMMKRVENTEEDYYKIRNCDYSMFKDDNYDKDILTGFRFFYLRKTCYRGMLRYNKNGGFNVPYGRYKTFNFEELKDERYYNLLKETDIHSLSFEKIFEMYDDENTFMFLDPPYDSVFTDYGYCSFGRDKQEELFKCFTQTKSKCLMVIGGTDYIRELYKDYIVDEYDKKYAFKIHSNRVNESIKHVVIKNY